MLKYALEEIRDDYVLDDDDLDGQFNQLEEYIEEAEMTAEFECYSKQFDKLVTTVSALEQIEEIIAEEPADIGKTNYEAVVEIANNLMISAGADPETNKLLSTESWGYSKEERIGQRQVALETIGTYVDKIYEAIKKFLLGMWNWLIELFNWQRIKNKWAKARLKYVEYNLDHQERRQRWFSVFLRETVKDIESGHLTDVSKDQTQELIDRIKAKAQSDEDYKFKRMSIKRNGKFTDTKGRTIAEVIDDTSAPISKAVAKIRNRKVSKENVSLEDFSDNGLSESIFSLIDSFSQSDICYNSSKSHYLISPEIATEVIRKRTAAEPKAILATFKIHNDIFESYFKYLDNSYLPALKKAIGIMTASSFDEKASRAVIDEIYPAEVKLKNIFGNYAIIEDNRVVLKDKICGLSELSIGFIPKNERESFLNVFQSQIGIGRYADAVAVKKTTIADRQTSPLIFITGNKSKIDTNWLDNSVTQMFEIFNKTSDFSNRYEAIIAGLNKAVERLSRKKTDDSANFALLGRLVMYSTNVYVNQLLTTFNSLAPKMIDSGCDFVDSHLMANDPTTIVSIL